MKTCCSTSIRPAIFNLHDNTAAHANGKVEDPYHNLSEQLILSYQAQIKQLQEEVAFLRGLLEGNK